MIQLLDSAGKPFWEAFPKQEEALLRQEDEILYGGARGGGKSKAGIVWLILGNPTPLGSVADTGYYRHPNYRALVLRKNLSDMGDWVSKAKEIYKPLGAEHIQRPCEFRFPSGATIVIGHLDDIDAFEHYQGQEFQRLLLEEATQIPTYELYSKVLASCRSPFAALRPQVFLTANPGGRGHSWVRERFVIDAPPGEPYTDPDTGRTRVFIPAGVKDNPIYADDKKYIGTLMALSPAMRRAWLDGDWDAIAGQYFCCDDKTEIFTRTGWKLFKDLSEHDEVATKGESTPAYFTKPSKIHDFEYEGNLCYYDTPSMNFAVTPDHRMYCRPRDGGAYSKVCVKDLPKHSYHLRATTFDIAGEDSPIRIEWVDSRKTPKIPTSTLREAVRKRDARWRPEFTPEEIYFNRKDFAELVGWYLTEGSLDSRGIAIAQSRGVNPLEYQLILECLQRLGLRGQQKPDRIRVCRKALNTYFAQFGKSSDKFVPEWIFESSRVVMEAFLRACVLGDGHHYDEHTFSYFSISSKLAEGVARVATLLGYGVSLSARMGGYWLYISMHPEMRVTTAKLKSLPYKGRVYCVTVDPHGLIFIRRNGRSLWTGNCEFRTEPASEEPPEARHVIHSSSVVLEPWYHRWIACDWGYSHDAAVYKACQLPNGQIHIYDELVLSRVTPEELGAEIGRFLWQDLKEGAQRAYQLFLSPDAFSRRTDEKTIADQIATGLERVLGPDSVYMPPAENGSSSDVFSRVQLAQSASVMIQRAANQRIPGWMFMKSLMRWWPLLPQRSEQFDTELAMRLQAESPRKYAEYVALFDERKEVLPKLQIHGDRCPKLIRSIPLARANDPDRGDPEDIDKRHFDGMDSLDSARYLLFASKFMDLVEPFEDYFAKHVSKYATVPFDQLDGNSKVMMARRAEKAYAELTGAISSAPIRFSQSSARARRRQEVDIRAKV